VIKKPKRIIERTDHSSGLYRAAFDRFIGQSEVSTILDVAAGDSPFAEDMVSHTGKRVIRIDRDYARHEPKGGDWEAGDATALPLEDDSVDVAISAFMMQHLTPDEQRRALAEMLRVVRPYTDGRVGAVGIFPLYKPKKLAELIQKNDLEGKLAITVDYDAFERLPIAERKLEQPTLWIPNWQGASVEEQSRLIAAIVESNALYRRTTLRDIARRAVMAHTGNPTVRLQ